MSAIPQAKKAYRSPNARTRTNLGSVGSLMQLQQQVLDGPHHFQRLARSSTIEQESHDCYMEYLCKINKKAEKGIKNTEDWLRTRVRT